MAEIVKVSTGSKTELEGSYSRAVVVGDLVFVSNTAGRNPETKLISPDVVVQTNQVLDNIARALAAIGAGLADVVAARVYVQFREDIDAVMEAYAKRMRGVDPTLTLTSPPLGSDEFKVEIEVTAYRGAGSARTTRITA